MAVASSLCRPCEPFGLSCILAVGLNGLVVKFQVAEESSNAFEGQEEPVDADEGDGVDENQVRPFVAIQFLCGKPGWINHRSLNLANTDPC